VVVPDGYTASRSDQQPGRQLGAVGHRGALFLQFMLQDRCRRRIPPRHLIAGLAAVSMLGAAAAPALAVDPTPAAPYERVINEAIESAIDDLVPQLRRLAAFAPALEVDVRAIDSAPGKAADTDSPRLTIGIDRSVGESSQASVASQILDSALLQAARRKLTQFEIVEISPPVVARLQYVLGGKLSRVDVASRGMYRVDLMLTDIKTSHVVAQSSVRFQAQGVDTTPLGSAVTP